MRALIRTMSAANPLWGAPRIYGLPVRTSHQFTNTLELFRGDRRRKLRIERAQKLVSLDIPPGRLQGLELVERARVIAVSRRK